MVEGAQITIETNLVVGVEAPPQTLPRYKIQDTRVRD